MKYFKAKNAALELAIEADNAAAVKAAIQQGADVNTKGLYDVTPINMAVGKFKKQAAAELLRHGADTAPRDADGDNAVTQAVSYYQKDPELLKMVLAAGGDPNTREADNDPVIVRFLNDHDMDTVRWFKSMGADIDALTRSHRPLIISYGISEDWDAVWTLLDLGARYDYTEGPWPTTKIFADPEGGTLPGSPLWPYKEKTWRFLCQHGVKVPPLTTLEMWEDYIKWGDENYKKMRPEQMPIITCDHATNTVKGEWGNLKPKVESAYHALKRRGEL